ncbi:hypothetical protein R2601_04063 [Salipiger bermudensis HTCC2601]|uniref:Uncharacterized protein n=1 Tax=Salipiger bermudensis (strain DSM 26914 / JCM 13377 / KCTC 12554 / HTCC2601) TaxID=314265 RepID=Q0FW33_SALBH|nr:hypothetical protein R2601_04063 [Salipiger bermudensis HTCC2601]
MLPAVASTSPPSTGPSVFIRLALMV